MASRRQLLRSLLKRLQEQGYQSVPGPMSGAAAAFYKPVDQLFLTLGIQFSTRYTDRFTGAFYLSRSFEWAYVPEGFPEEAYQRIGRFLTPEERARLLTPFFAQAGVVDAWWVGFEESTVTAFIEAVKVTEPRFLRQSGLREAVLACDSLRRHRDLLEEVSQTARTLTGPPPELVHQPGSYVKAAGPQWYWAAEVVLRHRAQKVNRGSVGMVALDAWRVDQLA